jgi:hypothetical protein
MKKKTAKAKKPASTRNLSPKKLTAKQASGVKGGNLMKVCATGEHMKEATITH